MIAPGRLVELGRLAVEAAGTRHIWAAEAKSLNGARPGQLAAKELVLEVPALLAEVERLRERLAAAETVCTLTGWTAADQVSEIGKARLQAWMDWSTAYGSPEPTPEWDRRIAELADRRDKARAAAIAAIHLAAVREEIRD